MRFLYWREESQTVETTLWFAMQEVWNMHADLHADFLFVRPGLALSTGMYCRVVVRDALIILEQRRERYAYVTHMAPELAWPEHHFYRPRGWNIVSQAWRDRWLDVEWPRMLRLELLGDGIVRKPVAACPFTLYHRESQRHLMQKCSRWHQRVKAARSARQLHARAQIPAVLERAALGLFARLDTRDVLDHVLQHAAAAMCAVHALDPRTLLPLPHM
jgi:hypothetical protein